MVILLLAVISVGALDQDVNRVPRININGITGDDFIGQAGLLYPFRNTECSIFFTDLSYKRVKMMLVNGILDYDTEIK